MNRNFSASTSENYSLHISNEMTEMSLRPDALSSANNFEVHLSPALDLNQLSFLQSTDVEVSAPTCLFVFFHSPYLLSVYHPPYPCLPHPSHRLTLPLALRFSVTDESRGIYVGFQPTLFGRAPERNHQNVLGHISNDREA